MNLENNSEASPKLRTLSDVDLITETLRRFQEHFKKNNKTDLRYGAFKFVIHDGELRSIESNDFRKLVVFTRSGVSYGG